MGRFMNSFHVSNHSNVVPLSDKNQSRLKRELLLAEQRLSSRFVARHNDAHQAVRYLETLLAPMERKNMWQLSEASGQKDPYGFQHLLFRSKWNEEIVRDDHLEWVAKRMKVNDSNHPRGTLVLDETGFLKKGVHSAGVARQYSGTAGRIENCQIGVFLSLLAPDGTRTLLDRELYLPEEWTSDPERCRKAHIPAYRIQHHQTKGALGLWMLKRAWMAGIRPAWVTGDEVYGRDFHIRLWCEEKSQPYVLAVQSNTYFWVGFEQKAAKSLLKEIQPEDWVSLSCGVGSKGLRIYDWAILPITSWGLPDSYQRFLLFRRSPQDHEDIEYYRVACHPEMTLQEVVSAAGTRWSIEECFESSKGEVGLDQYEVRSYQGWYRHMTLAMMAHALLAFTQARFRKLHQYAQARKKKPKSKPAMAPFLQSRGLWPRSA
jgi:SRSO17 transposase